MVKKLKTPSTSTFVQRSERHTKTGTPEICPFYSNYAKLKSFLTRLVKDQNILPWLLGGINWLLSWGSFQPVRKRCVISHTHTHTRLRAVIIGVFKMGRERWWGLKHQRKHLSRTLDNYLECHQRGDGTFQFRQSFSRVFYCCINVVSYSFMYVKTLFSIKVSNF